MARLKEQYKAEVAPALYKKFGYKSTMQIPKIDKVVVNVGCGEAKENAKVLEAVVRDLTTITGQKAIPHRIPIPPAPEARHYPGPQVHRKLQAA